MSDSTKFGDQIQILVTEQSVGGPEFYCLWYGRSVELLLLV